MSSLITQIEIAKKAFEQQFYLESIAALKRGLKEDLSTHEQNKSIQEALLEALDLVEQYMDFPEFRNNQLVMETTQHLRLLYQDYLEGQQVFEEVSIILYTFYLMVAAMEGGIQMLERRGGGFGSDPNPTFCFGIKQNGSGELYVQLYGRVSAYEGGMSLEEVRHLQDNFFRRFHSNEDSKSSHMTIALQLSTEKKYRESIHCLEQILENYPDDPGGCFTLIGANYFYLGDYESAISFYLHALDANEDPEMIEFNVWESCVELIKNQPEEKTRWVNLYRKHFPQGERPL